MGSLLACCNKHEPAAGAGFTSPTACVTLTTIPETAPKRASLFKNVRLPARVVRIIDGDTVEVVTRATPQEPFCTYSVRLNGCDAPELKSKLPDEVLAARAAKDFLASLLPVQSGCALACAGIDKYGRLLADIAVAGPPATESVAQAMIARGHAVPYHGGHRAPWAAHAKSPNP